MKRFLTEEEVVVPRFRPMIILWKSTPNSRIRKEVGSGRWALLGGWVWGGRRTMTRGREREWEMEI